ncbi:hypothetical protein GALL_250580 [mine drainage metagenome]|uniref:Uncharacterized protein n=1 Tax=mine drainage metagenome TaxID=410659 RepID=A0A1J5RAB7_9ZZZZ
MSKEDMINWLLREIASDRFRTSGSAGTDGARSDQAAEWLRLNARSHGEIEVLYYSAEELYALSA